jgi:acyl-homoserine-lactone acylase
MNRPVAALEQSYLRTKTRDLSEFLKVAERKANSSNNTLFADDKGEIAYLHPQFVPIRDTRFDYTKPVDGSDPATDWRGLHALDTLPSVLNRRTAGPSTPTTRPGLPLVRTAPESRLPRLYGRTGRKPTWPPCGNGAGRAAGLHAACAYLGCLRSLLPAFEHLLPPLFDAAASDPGNADRQAAIALLKGWDRRWCRFDGDDARCQLGQALWAKRRPSRSRG